MSGELRPRFLFKEGDEFTAVWEADLKYCREDPGTTVVRVVKVGRKYVYFEIDKWGRELRQTIDHPSRNIGGYRIEIPELDAYDARMAEAKELLKERGFTTTGHYAFSGATDEDLLKAAEALR